MTWPFPSRLRYKQVTICPCCGVKLAVDLAKGCTACGARSVGEPLPLPEQLLPSYGRALLLAVVGALMVFAFLVQVIIALFQRVPFAFSLRSLAIAAQAAAWHLKWVAIPVTFIVFVGCRKIYKSVLHDPARFCGVRYARRGFIASSLVCLLIAMLIAVSVPARLRSRQLAIEAGYNAEVHRVDRALLEYVIRFNTFPADFPQDLTRLPDPDGSLAAAIRELGPTVYRTSGGDLAALPQKKPRSLRGAVIRNASVDSATDETLPLSFTNYELHLPGADKILGTEDDLIVRDGLITKASEAGPGVIGSTASTTSSKP